jgi:hypothetical protein
MGYGFSGLRIFMAEAEFPSNSYKSKTSDERVEKIEKLKTPAVEGEASAPVEKEKVVLEGKTVVQKKGVGTRLKDMFVTDGVSFGEHLAENVVVPMIKDIILTIIRQTGDGVVRGFEEMLHPKGSGQNDVRTSGRTQGPISYNNLHRSSVTSRREETTIQYRSPARRSNRVEEVIFEYRSDAQKALTYLEGQIEELGHCTVGDLYDFVEYPMQSTDEQWGWTDLSRAYIQEVGRNKYRLNMPEPDPIRRR